ncbi:unnamed protein product, partial [Didymodactylos carnosus]
MNPGDSLSRQALGIHKHIGALYNRQTDNFCNGSLFDSSIQKTILQTNLKHSPTFRSSLEDLPSRKLDLLGVDRDLKLSILSGLSHIDNDYAAYIYDGNKSSTSIKFSLVYREITASQTFDMFQSDIKRKMIINSSHGHNDATHFLVDVEYGFAIIISFEITNVTPQKSSEYRTKINHILNKIVLSAISASTSYELVNDEKELLSKSLMTIFTDISEKTKITTMAPDNIITYLKNISTMVEKDASLASPMRYTFYSKQRYLKDHAHRTTTIYPTIKCLETDLVRVIIQEFDYVQQAVQELSNFVRLLATIDNSYIHRRVMKYEKLLSDAKNRQQEFHHYLSTLLVEFRTENLNAEEIRKFVKDYQTQECPANNIKQILNCEKVLQQKAMFILSLDILGIVYFDITIAHPESAAQISSASTSKVRKNEFLNIAKRLPTNFDKGECYVFYCISENCLNETETWKQFLKKSKTKSRDTKCIYMDCTNCAESYQPPENKICYYKDGRSITEEDKDEVQMTAATGKDNANRDINILLLGETGVGKSTFINAFVNYLTYDTLGDAINGEPAILIPASFSITDSETFEQRQVKVGDIDANEVNKPGQSATQVCRTYSFPIADRTLRIIDTPGVGDTRGLQQDGHNLEHIISHLSRYQHLNGICMLLKPNASRLNTFFRFCITQLLSYLDVNAKDNIIFCFTNARSTFYSPGNTTALLKQLLRELHETSKIDIQFSKQNTFCFDNEAFRFLVAAKSNLKFDNKQENECSRSWDVSVNESFRFVQYVLSCTPYNLRDTIEFNKIRKIILELARPVLEATRTIQMNLKCLNDTKREVNTSTSTQKNDNRIPHIELKKICLEQPRTCDTIQNPHIVCCEVFATSNGRCYHCNCSWEHHMHMYYETKLCMTYLTIPNASNIDPVQELDKRIESLNEEQKTIIEIPVRFIQYLKENSITAFNDPFADYMNYFVSEERLKCDMGANNQLVLNGLEKVQELYIQKLKSSANSTTTIGKDEIMNLLQILYSLPHNGPSIKQQMDLVKTMQVNALGKTEKIIDIPKE